MSTALAIAGVTHVLRELLREGLVNLGAAGVLGTTVEVTAQPPDRLATATAAGGGESTGLNLFLYRTSPNLGWRNEGLPSRDASGRGRLTNPPLALDLHYLLSAHGPGDLHAEILLGHAMLLFHDKAIVPRLTVRAALQPSGSTPPALAALANSGLEDQLEQLKITPEHLSAEELSKFWTAAQAHYRPSAGYQVSVVLIQTSTPARGPLPVLERRAHVRPDLGIPFPTLETVTSADGQPTATLGTAIRLNGHDLGSGPGREVVLVNERLVLERTRQETGASSSTRIELTLDDSEGLEFPVGVYRVGARLGAGAGARVTNQLAFTLAPKITAVTPSPVIRDPATLTAVLTVSFVPPLRPGQGARLVLGERECAPDDFSGAVSSLTFTVTNAPLGSHPLRLRVDGIDSAVIDLTTPVPSFKRVEIQ